METYKKKSRILNRLLNSIAKIAGNMYLLECCKETASDEYIRLKKYFEYGKLRINNISNELKEIDITQ